VIKAIIKATFRPARTRSCGHGLDDHGRPRLALVEAQPWYASASCSALEHRRELEDRRLRLFALAVGDHLPVELAQRAGDLTAELDWIA